MSLQISVNQFYSRIRPGELGNAHVRRGLKARLRKFGKLYVHSKIAKTDFNCKVGLNTSKKYIDEGDNDNDDNNNNNNNNDYDNNNNDYDNNIHNDNNDKNNSHNHDKKRKYDSVDNQSNLIYSPMSPRYSPENMSIKTVLKSSIKKTNSIRNSEKKIRFQLDQKVNKKKNMISMGRLSENDLEENEE